MGLHGIAADVIIRKDMASVRLKRILLWHQIYHFLHYQTVRYERKLADTLELEFQYLNRLAR
jgi:hypothetical protein